MKFSAVIFDLDGVLIDSELHWFREEMKFLKQFNIQLKPADAFKLSGKSLYEVAGILKAEHGLLAPIDDLLGQKKAMADKIYRFNARKMRGVDKLLKVLEKNEYKIAIASGSALKRVKMIVERFGWKKYFDKLVSTEQVNLLGKPDPAIYRYAAMSLKVKPENCLVFEDSLNGVYAAHGAGMQCVGVPDARWSWGDFSEADLVIDSLADKKLFNFLGL
ncbi:MAG: HAD family phosphatase [Candidatus Magasanikbacteria bacterium]|nr:HAD family phosphatase [Candidatus Magasanikbacteria bacterium]